MPRPPRPFPVGTSPLSAWPITSSLSALLLVALPAAHAQGYFEVTDTFSPTEYRAVAPVDLAHYYIGYSSGIGPEIGEMIPFAVILGETPPVELVWPIPGVMPTRQFFRIGRVPLDESLDLDGDGITDVAELRFAFLNPLFAGDAGLDQDNDGLSNAVEINGTTDPEDADSDDDGYWDGIESLNAGDPNDGESIPAVPFARFETPTTFAVEGATVINVTLTFSSAVNATVPISVAAMTTATEDADYRLTQTSIAVSGTQAQISIELLEDAEFENVELIVLDLLPDDAGSYAVAGGMRHLVHLEDNDRYWSGRLKSALGSLGFRLKITRDSNGSRACFASTEDPDDEFFGSSATGTIPAGEHDLTEFLYDDTTFSGASVGIRMGKGSLLTNSMLERVISFEALLPELEPGSDRAVIRGRMTDAIRAEDRSKAYLDQQVSGTFTLVRNPAILPEPPVAIKQAEPNP